MRSSISARRISARGAQSDFGYWSATWPASDARHLLALRLARRHHALRCRNSASAARGLVVNRSATAAYARSASSSRFDALRLDRAALGVRRQTCAGLRSMNELSATIA